MKFCCLLLYHPVYQNKYNTIDKIIFEAKDSSKFLTFSHTKKLTSLISQNALNVFQHKHMKNTMNLPGCVVTTGAAGMLG